MAPDDLRDLLGDMSPDDLRQLVTAADLATLRPTGFELFGSALAYAGPAGQALLFYELAAGTVPAAEWWRGHLVPLAPETWRAPRIEHIELKDGSTMPFLVIAERRVMCEIGLPPTPELVDRLVLPLISAAAVRARFKESITLPQDTPLKIAAPALFAQMLAEDAIALKERGLMQAARDLKSRLGVRFAHYADETIANLIRDHYKDALMEKLSKG